MTYNIASAWDDFTHDSLGGPTTGPQTLVAHSSPGYFQTPVLAPTASSDPSVNWIHVWARKNAGPYYLTVDGGSRPNVTASAQIDGRLYDGSVFPGVPYTPRTLADRVNASSIAAGPTGRTARKVHRTVVNGSQLKQLTTIANNTATTIATDTAADASLGANAPTADTSGL